jgi:hypothetical protein
MQAFYQSFLKKFIFFSRFFGLLVKKRAENQILAPLPTILKG